MESCRGTSYRKTWHRHSLWLVPPHLSGAQCQPGVDRIAPLVSLPKPTPIKTTLDPHANQACDKAEAEAGRGPASAVLFCHRVAPAGTRARLKWARAGLREEWDGAAVPREQLRSAWQGSWRAAPERPTRNSGWALSGALHSPWHHLPRISSIALAATSKRTRGSLFESACVDLWPFCTQDACDVDIDRQWQGANRPRRRGPKNGTAKRAIICPTKRFHQQLVEPQAWTDCGGDRKPLLGPRSSSGVSVLANHQWSARGSAHANDLDANLSSKPVWFGRTTRTQMICAASPINTNGNGGSWLQGMTVVDDFDCSPVAGSGALPPAPPRSPQTTPCSYLVQAG